MPEITYDVKTVGIFKPHERRAIEVVRQKRRARVDRHDTQVTLDGLNGK